MANLKTEERKKQIIKVAAKVFAERGFQESTIAEISKEAKISEASIYEYFTTKEGLLFSIPTESAKDLFGLMEFHLKLIKGSANKLRAIVYLFMDSYQTNNEFASIMMLILKHNRKFLDTEGHKAIRKGIKNINSIIEEGIESGEFKKDINVYLVRSMILGTVEHLTTNWIMTGTPDQLLDYVDPIVDTLIDGISNRENRSDHWSMQKNGT
ncbi:MAG: TetR/AcrR family transcriptional regulator [Desulfobacterales bacterium]|nr:TetR/AcrR family transcriptional regulator [Desulfobacterales bacterium]MCP4163262.1 TetR/AcrR family transcriptional regulator [Deltaproteobacteria bacterium]